MHFFSFVQCLGYLACVLGVAAFLQKSDVWLKGLLGVESLVYTIHFWLLDDPAAAFAALLSGIRSGLAIKTRSRIVAGIFLAVNLFMGIPLVHHWTGIFPIVGGLLGTVAMFCLQGLPMRLVLLSSTCCWLANNVAVGSIGGIVLETFNALANGVTIVRFISAQSAGHRADNTAEQGSGGNISAPRPLNRNVQED